MEDITQTSETPSSNERLVIIPCEKCDNIIHETKIIGIDKIIYCKGCNTRYVAKD